MGFIILINEYWTKINHLVEFNRFIEQAQIKSDIITRVFQLLNTNPRVILFPKFNPIVLLLEKHHTCYVVDDQSVKYTWQSESQFIDKITDVPTTVDVTIALDEYFTYANSETEQRNMVAEIKSVTKGYLITTIQDYKNNAPHKRNQVDTFINDDTIVLEQNIMDKINRQNWKNHIYFIENQKDLTVLGPIDRRTMYFKQLAKYTSDLGGTNYVVQKNLLYRGFFKKNYEHIITVQF